MTAKYDPIYSQPLRSVYHILSVLSLILRIPFWTITSLSPTWRPRPAWSLRKTVAVSFYRWLTRSMHKAGYLLPEPNAKKLEVNSDGVWVPPVPKDVLANPVSKWATEANVEPTKVPGYWYHGPKNRRRLPNDADKDKRVIYYLHGGGFAVFSAHPSSPPASICRGLLARTDFDRLFSLEYRLSSHDGRGSVNPFPTSLIDAISGYHYLTETLGYSPRDILVAGDSAGANLAMGLTRYLRDTRPSALPSRLLLLSPWVDLISEYAQDIRECQSSDFLCEANANDWLTNSVACYAGHLPDSAFTTNPYLSPANKALQQQKPLFEGFPPTFITIGEAEQLRGSQRAVVDFMRRDMGHDAVEVYEAKDCVHDYLLFDWEDGTELRKTHEAIARWCGH